MPALAYLASGVELRHSYQATGTRRMAALLAELSKNSDSRLILQRLDRHLARYARGISQPTDLRTATLLQATTAYDLLLRGESKEAALHFQRIRDTIAGSRSLFDSNFLSLIRSYLAISYLRAGEQDNCIERHAERSCLFPITGSGVHSATSGSRAALKVYEEILESNPGDLTARWLLNLAYMTLGEYPEAVPKQWLLSPEIFKSESEPFGKFDDAAPRLGVDVRALAGGAILEDFDRDGYVDIMASSFGLDEARDQLRYFHNNGDGTFTDHTKTAGLMGLVGGMNLLQADYDNNGSPDVLVLRGGSVLGDLGRQPPSLLRNKGDGTFDDVTREAGLLHFHPTQAAAWGDYDNDGWL
ncbi:MAG: FG-GAP-like repeat-containing protein, partial [Acidimicrobiia bacterium]